MRRRFGTVDYFFGHYAFTAGEQWSFGKTETMGTLASHAEIDVWVQAPGAVLQGPGVSPQG